MPAMSSTMPRLVEPAVATTAKIRVAAPAVSASTVARRAAPVSRPRSSPGTSTTSTSITYAQRVLDRRVRLLGHADRPAGRARAARGRGGRLAGRDQRRQVADRAARHEHAAGRRRQPGQVGDPAQRLVLGVDRAGALEPRSAVDARRPDDHVEGRRRLGRRVRDEGQVARDDRRTGRPARARRPTAAAPRRRRCRPRSPSPRRRPASSAGVAGWSSGTGIASRSMQYWASASAMTRVAGVNVCTDAD